MVKALTNGFSLAEEKEDAAQDYLVGRYYSERSEDNDEISMNKKLIGKSKEKLSLEEVSALDKVYGFLEEIFSFVDDYSLDKFKEIFVAAQEKKSDFFLIAEILVKNFGMSNKRSIINYLAGMCYASIENAGDEISRQEKRYREASKDFDQEELAILNNIYEEFFLKS